MALQQKIDALEEELEKLRGQLRQEQAPKYPSSLPLETSEYRRYGRQMILPGFGMDAQVRLKNAKVLVVGAGGLGCPALLYLASAGVGHITVIDHDHVELSNLHRQVLHTERAVSKAKVDSAVDAIKLRNSSVHVDPIYQSLDPSLLVSPELDFASFDLVLDCSDNAPTRYLLNDACVAYGKPLVSGAAIRLEGQLVVWNLPPPDEESPRGPCYRCVFPETTATQGSQNCEDEGVLGTVTGTIGTLMASEAIKLLTHHHHLDSRLTLYSWSDVTPFRTVKIKGKRDRCLACKPEGAKELLQTHLQQQRAGEWTTRICGIGENVPVGPCRISVQDLAVALRNEDADLIDVRPKEEFSICALPGFRNLPLQELLRNPPTASPSAKPALVLCRRGNDSVTAVKALQAAGILAKDIQGGLRQYALEVDPAVPIY